jgi:DNA-binding CsgD family transcriptional regulator/PAS domain-containing protein
MGAKPSILMQARYPSADDPDIRRLLELAVLATGASWAELELRLDTGGFKRFTNGAVAGPGVSLDLSADGFGATLQLGLESTPEARAVGMLSFSLEKTMSCRRYREQISLLRGALDTTTSAVLMFDKSGGIVYANPPADRLLARQTEDGLAVESGEESCEPLVSYLCSKAEHFATGSDSGAPWTGTLTLSDGTTLACEILRVETEGKHSSIKVLALLQPVPSLSRLCLDSFCTRHRLSPREQDVVRLLLEGLTTNGIADRLNISLHTVRDHLKRLYRKTRVRSRSELLSLLSTAGAPPAGRPSHGSTEV